MTLRVYNTLTRQKETFETVEPGRVGIYLCGPTVYKPSHLGHMVGPVIFDTVKRYLVYKGYKVFFVVNITDVDDKLIDQAKKQNTTVRDLAERITADYVENLKKLGVTSIDRLPRATEYISDIIAMIGGLIDKGYAYPSDGDVYFDVTRDEDYGKLCNRDPEQLEAGARIEVSDRKRSPGDFALWKCAKPGEPKWDSPWGPGRPGWHIECSAMSMKLLGQTLDIHGGGLDLQFPHHENELAQSESYTGQPFARYWMHNGLMKTGNDKMSKSKGNEIVVSELLRRHPPQTLRFFLLATHYRRPIDFSEERLEETQRGVDNFQRFFERYGRITGESFFALQGPTTNGHFETGETNTEFLVECSRHRGQFLDHMEDDFNTGGAIGSLFELLTTLNRFADARKLEENKSDATASADFRRGVVVLKELSQILGLFGAPSTRKAEVPAQLLEGLKQLVAELQVKDEGQREACRHALAGEAPLDELMNAFIDLRARARKAKDFALADQIRQSLGKLNITLEDRPGGTDWRLG